MKFNKHYALEGQHAFMSASKYGWADYDSEDQIIEKWESENAAAKGTRLHDLACQLIREDIDLPKRKQTLNLYVNDALGFRMTPEQPLYYSPYCFGTADAISFRDNTLRIHDLKTGRKLVAKFEQLYIYAALFCLEYRKNPEDIKIELRIYQFDERVIDKPEASTIRNIMDKIVRFNKAITEYVDKE